jgi:teichuronic acid biosynthesis glycosyltransferase TuaG
MGKMSQEPLVSIITPSYNAECFIEACIASVKAQSYNNWEMIIVDDCSKDKSVVTIERLMFDESRIKLISLSENVGAANARNRALKEAKGEYIAFLDSDDLWEEKKLEKQISFMQKYKYAFTFTAYVPISEDATRQYSVVNVPQEIDYAGYCQNTIIGCLTVMIDREQTGDFRMPVIKSSQDMALWLLLMKRGFNAYGLNEVLAKYRLVENSNTSKKIDAAKDVWRVYREIEQLPLLKSSWYFVHYIFNAIKKRV